MSLQKGFVLFDLEAYVWRFQLEGVYKAAHEAIRNNPDPAPKEKKQVEKKRWNPKVRCFGRIQFLNVYSLEAHLDGTPFSSQHQEGLFAPPC